MCRAQEVCYRVPWKSRSTPEQSIKTIGRRDGSGLPEERTEMAVAADSKHLYLRILCSEALLDPVLQRTHEVVANATRRDGAVHQDDHVEVAINSTGGKAGQARIAINPKGAVLDAWVNAATETLAWSSQATVATRAETRRWCVELAVPFTALGGAPRADSPLLVNVSRDRSADRTTSSWSPQGMGAVALGGPPIGLTQQRALAFEEGAEHWQFRLRSPVDLSATVLLRYGDNPWNATSTALPSRTTPASVRVPYTLTRSNAGILLDAGPTRADRTLCFRTNRLPVRGNTLYRFQARVKTEDIVVGKGRPISLAISSYGSDDKAIKAYEILVSVPAGTTDWQTVETTWQAPRKAASILFWGVKWGRSGASGKVWFDDLNLCPLDSFENVLPNGGVALTEDGSVTGWNLFSGATKSDSYEQGDKVRTLCELRTADGALLMRSAVVLGTVTARITAIDAALLLKAGRKDSDNVFRYKELCVTEGGVLALPVVLRSSHAERLEWADLLLDVPRFLHLLDPFPRAQIRERQRDGDRRRYRIRFEGDMISPVEGDKHSLKVGALLLECGNIGGHQAPFDVLVGSAIQGAQGETKTVPLTVLSPLQWRRPEVALIKHWACGSFYREFRRLNDTERDALAQYWRQAGFNRTGGVLEETLRKRYGFSARGHIPLITAPACGFPGGMEYLADHPEAQAMRFSGQIMKNTFGPTYFLSNGNKHLPEAREWLAEHARKYPHLDWDYEVPVTRDTSLCVCDRCIAAFCQANNLPTDGSVNRENIREKHRREWIDWRCRENARIAHFFREVIKETNPHCLFSIYSDYQGSTDEKGVYHGRYRRGDEMAEITSGGNASDVTVLLRRDERLVFVFNHTAEERVFALTHRQWQDGMVCLDTETRECQQRKHEVTLPPKDVRIFHLRRRGKPNVGTPKRITGDNPQPVRQPIAAWQGTGDYPGDQLFELQISQNPDFPTHGTRVIRNLTRSVFLPSDLRLGTPHWWRVRALEVPSGQTSPWSTAGQLLRSAFTENPGAIPAFSPNGDGVLDTLTVKAELATSIPWELKMRDARKQTVRTIKGEGEQVSAVWDGKMANGSPAPEGTYEYVVVPDGRAELAAGGSVEVNMRVGLENPAFGKCSGFVLTVAAGSGSRSKDYSVTLGDTYSVRLDASAANTTAYWSNYASGGVGSGIIPVKPETKFRFASRIRTDLKAGEACIALAFFTADGRWAQVVGHPPWGVAADPVEGTSHGWQARETVLAVPNNAISAVLFFRIKDAHGKAWFGGVEAGVVK